MHRIAVDSSNLAAVGYESSSYTLEIEFWNGGIYQYFNVPPVVYRQLMGAPSLGRYLARVIKPRYRCLRVV